VFISDIEEEGVFGENVKEKKHVYLPVKVIRNTVHSFTLSCTLLYVLLQTGALEYFDTYRPIAKTISTTFIGFTVRFVSCGPEYSLTAPTLHVLFFQMFCISN
jgi:hypothetical protein